MFSRRALVGASAGLMLAASMPATSVCAAAIMTDDGFYREDWFLDSFLVLADDRKDAAATGRHLVLIWEQRGCSWCREVHLVNFADKAIESYVRAHFEVLQLDLHGSRIITDFDGEQLGERQLAAKYGIHGTPTIQFFARGGDLAPLAAKDREVHRIHGYLPREAFLAAFVAVGGSNDEHGARGDRLIEQM